MLNGFSHRLFRRNNKRFFWNCLFCTDALRENVPASFSEAGTFFNPQYSLHPAPSCCNQLCNHTAPPVVLFVICLSYRIIIAYMYTILLAKRYCTFAGVVIKCICKIVFP